MAREGHTHRGAAGERTWRSDAADERVKTDSVYEHPCSGSVARSLDLVGPDPAEWKSNPRRVAARQLGGKRLTALRG